MSDNSKQQDVPPKGADEAKLSAEKPSDAGQSSQPKQESDAAGGAGGDSAQEATPPTQTTRLKSHFKGMPKNWEINRSK